MWRSWTILCTVKELNLSKTLFTGQTFTWTKVGDEFVNVYLDQVVVLKELGDNVVFKCSTQVIDDTSHLNINFIDDHIDNSIKVSMDDVNDNGIGGNIDTDVDSKHPIQPSYNSSRSSGSIAQAETHTLMQSFLKKYFELGINITDLHKHWIKDDNFAKKSPVFLGTRILKQPPIETILSFICSQNNNIKRISSLVGKLRENYGVKYEYGSSIVYSYPTISNLLHDTLETELIDLGFGYRAKYIVKTAKMIASKPDDWIENLYIQEYESCKESLLELPGVGPKVSDCICLFAFQKYGTVPVDTHVWNIAVRDYKMTSAKSLNARVYRLIGERFREIFGEFAGWAHTLLFIQDLKLSLPPPKQYRDQFFLRFPSKKPSMEMESFQLCSRSLQHQSQTMEINDQNIFSIIRFNFQNTVDYNQTRQIINTLFPQAIKKELMLNQLLLLIEKEFRGSMHVSILAQAYNTLLCLLESHLKLGHQSHLEVNKLIFQLLVVLDWMSQSQHTKSIPTSKAAKTRLAQVLKIGNNLKYFFDSIFDTTYRGKNDIRNCILIGVCVDTALSANIDISNQKTKVVDFICQSVLATKTPVSSVCLSAIGSSCKLFIDQETLSDRIVTQSDRLLLRSPEVSLKGLLKSSNVEVQGDTVRLYQILCMKCTDPTMLLLTVENITKSLIDKNLTPEQKVYLYNVLSLLSKTGTVSDLMLEMLPEMINEEYHDNCIIAALSCYATHVVSVKNRQISPEVAFLLHGISNTGFHIRRAYLRTILRVIAEFGGGFCESDQTLIFNNLSQVAVHSQNKGISIAKLKKDLFTIDEMFWVLDSLLDLALKNDELNIGLLLVVIFNPNNPLSLVFSKRHYYTKLSMDYGRLSLSKLLTKLILHESLFNMVGVQAIGDIFVWNLINGSTESFKSSLDILTNAVIHDTKNIKVFSDVIQIGWGNALNTHPVKSRDIWNTLIPISSREMGQKLTRYIHSLLPTSCTDLKVIEETLVDLLVICCHPTITQSVGNDFWIRLVYRSGLSPTFIGDYEHIFTDMLSFDSKDYTRGGLNAEYSAGFQMATLAALKICSRILPSLLIPKCMLWAMDIIESKDYSQVSPMEVAIWNTSSGVLFHNPLEKSDIIHKNGLSKDEKWELELKLELEIKNGKGNSVKLSKGDQIMIDEHIIREQVIKDRVESLNLKLHAALDVLEVIFDAVISDTTTCCRHEAQQFVTKINDVILHNLIAREYFVMQGRQKIIPCGVLAGSRSFAIYSKYAEIATCWAESTIDSQQIVFANLMACGLDLENTIIPIRFSSIPLSKMMTESVELLKEAVEDNALTTVGFMFVFPLLLSLIMGNGNIYHIDEKNQTDMILTSADILLKHCGLQGHDSLILCRTSMIDCLLLLLKEYPRLREAARSGLLALALASSQFPMDEVNIAEREIVCQVANKLLDGINSNEGSVRASCIAALSHLPILDTYADRLSLLTWISQYDSDENVAAEAQELWNEMHQSELICPNYADKITQHVINENLETRLAAGKALCAMLQENPDLVVRILENLYLLYDINSEELQVEYDEYGMLLSNSLKSRDQWESRSGVAHALEACVPVIIEKNAIMSVFDFLTNHGGLDDRDERVQKQMLRSGLALLEAHSQPFIKDLLDVLGRQLDDLSVDLSSRKRQAIVILMGTLARYLPSSDLRISQTIVKLIDNLKTPSEMVLVSISECLPALIKIDKENVAQNIKDVLAMLFDSECRAHRRGAAYGLAGIVKGAGISILKDNLIMAHLKDAIEDKHHIRRREGSIFAFETFSSTLGRIFEPYIIQILPNLLICYGDNNSDIRLATENTCRVIMSKLSAHCVKLLLPSLINGLHERAFRTKIGAIEVMASMSALAPKQLGQSLPTIVPEICQALGDSHQKVQEAARAALIHFGKVIKNPEIQGLVPVLIAALVNPNLKTLPALDCLLGTAFVHYIDSPSLALLVPIIERGLKERSAETKKKAAQIIGNMSSLTEPCDFVPYLKIILPSLKEVLVDPVPQARATAAKAFGSMVGKLGESNFAGLVEEMMINLQSDTSGVDRNGAAQGLSEVLGGIGIARLEKIMPTIINNANSVEAFTREGFTTLLVYLPHTFGDQFTPFIPRIIPTMLEGLADEVETIREAALHVGKVIVKDYAKSAVALLLPELEKGLFYENWRVRHSSLQLIGDLIFKIAGISQTVDMDETDEQEGFGVEIHRIALEQNLGGQYENILASLYIVRADSSSFVRQTSIGVWKAIVTNTPKTLKKILPSLMNTIISSLASNSIEKRGVAARTLGDLARRLGDGIATSVIPIFQAALQEDNSSIREGVCIGLSEIMSSASQVLDESFFTECIPLVRLALIDQSRMVRNSAAKTFDILHQQIGSQAIDDIIPNLLASLKTCQDNYALGGLKEIMAIRSNVVFPVLIPTLLASPISIMNAQALSALISVAGVALHKKLDIIIPLLIDELETNTISNKEIFAALSVIMTSVSGAEGTWQVCSILTGTINNGITSKKITAFKCLILFCDAKIEFIQDYISEFIGLIVRHMQSNTQGLVQASWDLLDMLVKRVNKDELDKYVQVLYRGIKETSSALDINEEIASFNLHKGILPFLAILLQGLTAGSVDVRELSARGLGEIVSHTSLDELKPFVTQITGPLIRVIGDRYPGSVKAAILSTLSLLLSKISPMLKPFLPQLQRTFVKALCEIGASSEIRMRSAHCLSLLIPLQTRLDPLVMELIQGIRVSDRDVQKSMWDALFGLLQGVKQNSGKVLNEVSKTNILAIVVEFMIVRKDGGFRERLGAAKCFGAYCNSLESASSRDLLFDILGYDDSDHVKLQGTLLALEAACTHSKNLIDDSKLHTAIISKVILGLKSVKSDTVEIAVAVSKQLLLADKVTDELLRELLCTCDPKNEFADSRLFAIMAIKDLSQKFPHSILGSLNKIVPVMMLSTRDRTIPIKLAAEKALVCILQIQRGNEFLEVYLKSLDTPTARSLAEYSRTVLQKVAARYCDDKEN